MKGRALSTGAISVVNALATGIGCAVGVGLEAEVEVEITESKSGNAPRHSIVGTERTALVEASLRAGLSRFLRNPDFVATLRVRSEIPVARGLKSSSAVSTAILLATARAAGLSPSVLEVGLLAADVGRTVGVSATGALDDALAGLGPGFVVTDNRRGEVLHRLPVEPALGVVLLVPPRPHPPSPALLAEFAGEKSAGEAAVRAAVEGDWVRAMQLNTELVERAMGYDYASLRERLRACGAVASGVSGLGPTLAAVAPTARLPEVLDALPSDGSQRLVVPFAGSAIPEVAAR